jgi:hypothetical protein
VSRCRSCEAPILWARTEKGRRIPLDPEPYDGPDPRGLFLLRADGLAIAVSPGDALGEPVYRSHFASCPDAALHRRSR